MSRNKINKDEASIQHQDMPRKEGQQSNVAPAGHPNAGDNNSVSVDEMMRDSEEQVKGRKDQQRSERNHSNQREERGGRKGDDVVL